jgi:hypothetical protein
MRRRSRVDELDGAAPSSLAVLLQRLDALEAHAVRTGRTLDDLARSATALDVRAQLANEVLQMIHDEEAPNRRRLYELRRSPQYPLAFDDPDPLVTVVIPTHTKAQMLRERSIPSALAQTHANIEVVVVGDASPPEVREAVESFDERVRFFNLTMRGPYSADPTRAWLSGGTPCFNRAIEEARGRWIAPLADDDTFTEDHVERLLDAARARRLELVYGLLRQVHPDGSDRLIGSFPLEQGAFGLQAALIHSGLRFMHMHLTDALFELPNDFALARRMIRVGVRIGMIDDVVAEYFPSLLWGRAELDGPGPPGVTAAAFAATPEPARDAPAAEPAAAQGGAAPVDERLPELERYVGLLEGQLAAIRGSRSWRWASAAREGSARLRAIARRSGLRPRSGRG